MSNLTPDDIERMNAAWDAIDAGLAKGDPRFAGYLATRARARLTPQITRRSGAMDETQSSLLLEALGQLLQALKAQTAALEAIDATLGGIAEVLVVAKTDQDTHLEGIGVTLGGIENEINALRTGDR